MKKKRPRSANATRDRLAEIAGTACTYNIIFYILFDKS